MKRYKNISGDAGVYAYTAGRDRITIQFNDSSVYLYNYAITGKEKVEEMKRLAEAGKGLTTFINQHVRDQYAEKIS